MMRLLIPVGLYTSPYPYLHLPKIVGPQEVEATVFTAIPIPQVTSLDHVREEELEIIKKYQGKLREIGDVLRDLGYTVAEKIVFARDVAEAIYEESIETPYDLIVLVKRKKPPRFLGRSVSRSLIHRVDKPLLILTMED